MTTERTYRCNLCRDAISEYAGAEKMDGVSTLRSGVGCYFVSTGKPKFVPLSEAEHHLCETCVKSVCEQARQMKIWDGF